MISVPAHPIDLATIRAQDLPLELEDVARTRRWDEKYGPEFNADHLGGQLRRTCGVIDLFTGADPDWIELTSTAKFFTRGSAALFTHLRRPERDHWRLRGHDRMLVGTSDEMYRSSSAWLDAFWLAFGLRDACSLALLLQTPVTVITATEAYERPMITAIQSTFARLPATGSRIVDALALADPDKTTRTWPPALLGLIVPVFEPLFALADLDEPRFAASLQKLLELRREYHLREKYDEGEKWNGRDRDNLSAEAVGLVGWARTLGMTVEVDSGYVPARLLDVPRPEVETCRVCLTPSDDDDPQARCHACDAPREKTLAFGFAEWVNLEREPCGTCQHPFPIQAATCPACLTSRRAG